MRSTMEGSCEPLGGCLRCPLYEGALGVSLFRHTALLRIVRKSSSPLTDLTISRTPSYHSIYDVQILQFA